MFWEYLCLILCETSEIRAHKNSWSSISHTRRLSKGKFDQGYAELHLVQSGFCLCLLFTICLQQFSGIIVDFFYYVSPFCEATETPVLWHLPCFFKNPLVTCVQWIFSDPSLVRHLSILQYEISMCSNICTETYSGWLILSKQDNNLSKIVTSER